MIGVPHDRVLGMASLSALSLVGSLCGCTPRHYVPSAGDVVVLGDTWRLGVDTGNGCSVCGLPVPVRRLASGGGDLQRLDPRTGAWHRIYRSSSPDQLAHLMYAEATDQFVCMVTGTPQRVIAITPAGAVRVLYAVPNDEFVSCLSVHPHDPVLAIGLVRKRSFGAPAVGAGGSQWRSRCLEMDLQTSRARDVAHFDGGISGTDYQTLSRAVVVRESAGSEPASWKFRYWLIRPDGRKRIVAALQDHWAAVCWLPGDDETLLVCEAGAVAPGAARVWRLNIRTGNELPEAATPGALTFSAGPLGFAAAVTESGDVISWPLGQWAARRSIRPVSDFRAGALSWDATWLAMVYPPRDTQGRWLLARGDFRNPPQIICLDAATSARRSYRTPKGFRPREVVWMPAKLDVPAK
jgi:hypothetical protein